MKIAFVNNSAQDVVIRGAGYIASVVKSAGYHLDFYSNCYISNEQIARKIIAGKYDLLLVSSMTIDFHRAYDLIERIKSRSQIKVLVGGVHASLLGERLIEDFPLIDYSCVGEGEGMILHFLQEYASGNFANINGLVYRKNKEVVSNNPGPSTDLNKLPGFNWDFFSERSVKGIDRTIYVFATRGCPYNCSYCCNTNMLKLYGKSYLRFRDIDDVINELKYLKKRYKPARFFFSDEMILADIAYARALFDRYRREIGVPFGCMVRVEHITAEVSSIMKESGCVYIGAGVECGDEEFRKKFLNRHMTNEQIISAYSIIKSTGIETASFNMIGYPVDYDDLLTERTVAINRIIRPDTVQISVFYPFPGTRLYSYCVENQLIDEEKIARTTDYYSDSVLKGRSVRKTKEEINALFPGQSMAKKKSRNTLLNRADYYYLKGKAIIRHLFR